MEKTRCIDEKGIIKHIPTHLTKLPDYMRRHKLRIDSVEPMELPKPIKEVNFEVTKGFRHEDLEPMEETQVMENFEEIAEESKEETKEHYWAILDEKGIEYKKTYGITKLKELCQ